MTDKLLPLSREELDELDKLPFADQLRDRDFNKLLTQAKTALDMAEEKMVLEDKVAYERGENDQHRLNYKLLSKNFADLSEENKELKQDLEAESELHRESKLTVTELKEALEWMSQALFYLWKNEDGSYSVLDNRDKTVACAATPLLAIKSARSKEESHE